ncbi:MAG: hypothetical protein A2086_08885 [Spirochaetes bacterium GWD1_27_9]|nr:MAG: hypothetical protein A2Z98_16405 [Spirochaetes bacterium GWB1_27_13]OHD27924.1 MAG: hypothetical protein A2Y34_14720 [Spirochaetes bacterium GWC1_27_15]OHD30745.1 MAG: hypothetical protein A2086_08885 [Spirochaetes bacterium GWD1_27_9]
MRKIIVVFFLILFFLQCRKNNSEFTDKNLEDSTNEEQKLTIDFEEMKRIIDSSKEIDVEVFFAISVYHKYTISEFENEVNVLSEEEQKKFYEKKKIEFFDSIKYTEEQYNDFMLKNINSMQDYLNLHPDIASYLVSSN